MFRVRIDIDVMVLARRKNAERPRRTYVSERSRTLAGTWFVLVLFWFVRSFVSHAGRMCLGVCFAIKFGHFLQEGFGCDHGNFGMGRIRIDLAGMVRRPQKQRKSNMHPTDRKLKIMDYCDPWRGKCDVPATLVGRDGRGRLVMIRRRELQIESESGLSACKKRACYC